MGINISLLYGKIHKNTAFKLRRVKAQERLARLAWKEKVVR